MLPAFRQWIGSRVLWLLIAGIGLSCGVRAGSDFHPDSLLGIVNASTHNREQMLKTLHLLVRGYLSENKPDSANTYLLKAMDAGKQSKDPALTGMTWYLQGKLHLSLLDYDRAMMSFIEADKLFKSAGAKKEHGLTEMQFGILLYAQHNFKAAGDYFKSANIILKAENDTLNAVTTQYLLGLSLTELNRFEDAEKVLKESLVMCTRYGFTQRSMESRMGLAELYLKMNRNEESIREAGLALDYYRTVEQEGTSDQSGKARAEFIIGKSAAGLGRFVLAEEMLEKALEHERLARHYDACVRISEALIHVYDYLEKYKKAIAQVQDMLQWKDSLKNSEAEQTMRILEDRQNIQLQNSRIELLTSQKENDKKIRFALIALAVVLLVLAVNSYQKFKLKKDSERKMDELLLNILPSEVAEELKTKGKATSRLFPSVTVMFVDIVDFTKMSERLSPETLVADLHHLFTGFDVISARHKLEKIKTLGDAYLCAGGVPVENETHAFDTIAAAREMLEFIAAYNQEKSQSEQLQVRIGIHSGPVVAGIVGIKKFAFDIWGDTVNIAARMEQSGEPGRINISGTTFSIVQHMVSCSSRGKVSAKNKGEISMYYVV